MVGNSIGSAPRYIAAEVNAAAPTAATQETRSLAGAYSLKFTCASRGADRPGWLGGQAAW